MEFTKEAYDARIAGLFERHQSVQSVGFTGDAYKPGLEAMLQLDEALGRPSSKFRSIHVAGTNGKGTVCSMLAAQLAASGMRVGLYTSPHLLDFRERIKLVEGDSFSMVSERDVWDFLEMAGESSAAGSAGDRILEGRSFFEITTALAFWWFSRQDIDVAVIETGLGGRLDSTNIIVPELSIVTSIGLDHCAILGDTRAKIAAEKAGIFKAGVPAVVASWDEETGPVFEARAREVHCPLFFADVSVADRTLPSSPVRKGQCRLGQSPVGNVGNGSGPDGVCDDDCCSGWAGINSATVRLALELLGVDESSDAARDFEKITGLRGRWETHMMGDVEIICDIGHNPPALQENFERLEKERRRDGGKLPLTIVYGVMADKDLASISHLMPADAQYILVAPATSRAMPAETLRERLGQLRPDLFAGASDGCAKAPDGSCAAGVSAASDVAGGVEMALSGGSARIIYIGGSTFVVSEAIGYLERTNK